MLRCGLALENCAVCSTSTVRWDGCSSVAVITCTQVFIALRYKEDEGSKEEEDKKETLCQPGGAGGESHFV